MAFSRFDTFGDWFSSLFHCFHRQQSPKRTRTADVGKENIEIDVESHHSQRIAREPNIDNENDTKNVLVASKDRPIPDGASEREDTAENKQNGTAYAYEDAETSSDSDDDVLQHYQENLKRGNSVRSVSHRSAKSARSGKSYAKKSQSRELLVSKAEKGYLSPDDQDVDSEAGAVSPVLSPSTDDSPMHKEVPLIQIDDTEIASPRKGSGDSESQQMLLGDTGDEHLFDVSDLHRDPEGVLLISKCGSLQVSFEYNPAKSRMTITVHEAKEIPSKERGGADNTQVKLLLLPAKKQKSKTKIKQGENPKWEETFVFNKVTPSEISNIAVRLRLVGNERMRRERLIGETVVPFQTLNHEMETTQWLTLEPRSNIGHGESQADLSSLGSASDTGSGQSVQSLQHGGMPELLLGLSYNGTTGRLSVQVIKGSNFRNMAMQRAPDTYVKLTLMNPTGQEIARSKTSIRRGQPNPLYKETFMFQVALFQLPDVTLMVSVYNKRSMKRKEMIGWFSLGLNSSGEEESGHWIDMKESGEVCRWHVLLES